MKRYVAILMVLCCMLGLAACGAGDRTSNGNATVSHAITANDLMQAMRDAGYNVEVDTSASVEDLDVPGATTVTMLGYHKFDGMEKGGFAYFFEFNSSADALSAYNELVSALSGDGIYMREVNGAHGEKSVFTDNADPDFGDTRILTQVENTLVFALEQWDIDSTGSYDYELNRILEDLGY